MFVCKDCHDTDRNATKCGYAMSGHLSLVGAIRGVCEICDTPGYVVFCSKYKSLTKPDNKKSCMTCAYRTECTKFFHAFGTYENKASECMTYTPENKYKEQTNGKHSR